MTSQPLETLRVLLVPALPKSERADTMRSFRAAGLAALFPHEEERRFKRWVPHSRFLLARSELKRSRPHVVVLTRGCRSWALACRLAGVPFFHASRVSDDPVAAALWAIHRAWAPARVREYPRGDP